MEKDREITCEIEEETFFSPRYSAYGYSLMCNTHRKFVTVYINAERCFSELNGVDTGVKDVSVKVKKEAFIKLKEVCVRKEEELK